MKPTLEGVEARLLREFCNPDSPLTDRQKIRSVAVDIFHYCVKPEKVIDAETARRESAMEMSQAFTDRFSPKKER